MLLTDTGTVELMAQGKAKIKDTDDALIRAQKVGAQHFLNVLASDRECTERRNPLLMLVLWQLPSA